MTASAAVELKPRALLALANSPISELHALQVEERDGSVVISGRVSSFYHKQVAQEVVRAVAGTARVFNSIRVE